MQGNIPAQHASDLVSASGKSSAEATAKERELQVASIPQHLANALIFVGSPQALAHAREAVHTMLVRAGPTPWAQKSVSDQKFFCVGLDSEWRPCFRKGESSRSSILQVALPHLVLIFDLHWMHSTSSPQQAHNHSRLPDSCQEEAIQVVHELLCNDRVLKVGFAFLGDLDKLYKDYARFQTITPFLELQEFLHHGVMRPQVDGVDNQSHVSTVHNLNLSRDTL